MDIDAIESRLSSIAGLLHLVRAADDDEERQDLLSDAIDDSEALTELLNEAFNEID